MTKAQIMMEGLQMMAEDRLLELMNRDLEQNGIEKDE